MTANGQPLVHVLVPARGRPDYLDQTLASTAFLTAYGWPVTVYDNATPGDELERVCEKHPHVEYLRHDVNVGMANNFNACVDHSTGLYTVLLGSDDLLQPTYPGVVSHLIHGFGSPAFVQPGVTVIDETNAPVFPLADRVKAFLTPHAPARGAVYSGDRLAARLLLGDWLYFPAIAWHTETLRQHPFSPTFGTAMDLDVILQMVLEGARMAYDPVPGLFYRRHRRSTSSVLAQTGTRFAEETSLSRQAAASARQRGWRRAWLAGVARPTVRANHAQAAVSRLRAGHQAVVVAPDGVDLPQAR